MPVLVAVSVEGRGEGENGVDYMYDVKHYGTPVWWNWNEILLSELRPQIPQLARIIIAKYAQLLTDK